MIIRDKKPTLFFKQVFIFIVVFSLLSHILSEPIRENQHQPYVAKTRNLIQILGYDLQKLINIYIRVQRTCRKNKNTNSTYRLGAEKLKMDIQNIF